MIQSVYSSITENKKQLFCQLTNNKEKIFEIDLKKTYKTVDKNGLYGCIREDGFFETMNELFEIKPNKEIVVLDISADKKYIRILDDTRIFWVHKYCLTEIDQ